MEEARMLGQVGARLALVSLLLLLTSEVSALTLGEVSPVRSVLNLITIGVLSGTATLLYRLLRMLRS